MPNINILGFAMTETPKCHKCGERVATISIARIGSTTPSELCFYCMQAHRRNVSRINEEAG